MSSVDELELLVDLAIQTLAGVTGASVSVLLSAGGSPETVTASSDLHRELDEHQYQVGDGPCLAAIRSGDEQAVVIGQGKYSKFEEAAAQAGIAYVWSLPMATEGGRAGSLNLYSSQVEGELDASSDTARTLAGLATKVLANDEASEKAYAINARLRAALASRGVIGQAQGIVMARQHIDPDRAFDILRRASQRENRKLRDLATELVASTTARAPVDSDGHGDR
jgi:hypothetical protein